MKVSKEKIKNIIIEELENMGMKSGNSDDSRKREIQFMIEKTWIGQVSEDENILELCNILAPAVMDEPSGERFSIRNAVYRVFEDCQQRVIEKLQRIVDDNELEGPITYTGE